MGQVNKFEYVFNKGWRIFLKVVKYKAASEALFLFLLNLKSFSVINSLFIKKVKILQLFEKSTNIIYGLFNYKTINRKIALEHISFK